MGKLGLPIVFYLALVPFTLSSINVKTRKTFHSAAWSPQLGLMQEPASFFPVPLFNTPSTNPVSLT